MTTYKYKARTADGVLVTGVVEAYSEFEAVEQIKRSCAIVEKITEVKNSDKKHFDINEPLWVEDKTLALTASQFSIMLRAGISIGRVVELIAAQTSDRLMKRILTDCAADVNAGYSLAHSLEKNGKKIPAAFIETVRAGEESGTLEICFDRLQKYYEKAYKVKKKVRSALTYPAVVILLSFVVVGIVMVVLVPTMIDLYGNMGQDLPFITRILIAVSDFFVGYWPFLLVGIAVIVIAYKVYYKTPNGELNVDKIKLKIPVIGKIGIMNSASQFANTVSTLLTAGLPASRVLSIVSRVVDNRAVGTTLEQAVVDLESGKNFGSVLKDNPYLPEMLVEMVSVGEESGSLEETMDTIGTYYDEEAVAASDKALGMLEPLLTIFLGVFVGFILLAVYLPMFNMYGGIAAS